MVNWQVTGKTVRCETAHDEVTLLVYKDWSVKCTGYSNSAKNNGRRQAPCAGPDCPLAMDYRRRLQTEEGISP
jgi:hypothetical protein